MRAVGGDLCFTGVSVTDFGGLQGVVGNRELDAAELGLGLESGNGQPRERLVGGG